MLQQSEAVDLRGNILEWLVSKEPMGNLGKGS